MKRCLRCINVIFIMIFCLFICNTHVEAKTAGKCYGLFISGRTGHETDISVADMQNVLKQNRNPKYSGGNVFHSFKFNSEDSGTTKAKFDKAIDNSFDKATKNDMAIFFYNGHGTDQNGSGLCLNISKNQIYTYKDLAEKLSEIKCNNILVIIDACCSTSFFDHGFEHLVKPERFTVFLSAMSDSPAWYIPDCYSRYTNHFVLGLGQSGTYYADFNNDGIITMKEQADYVKTRMYDDLLEHKEGTNQPLWELQEPFVSYNYNDTILYQYKTYNNIKESSVKLNKSNATIYTTGNKTLQLKATVKGSSKKVTWKSSNKKIATVNSKGKVTAKKTGTVKITAKANGKTATCKVTVKKPSIKLNKKNATIYTSGEKTIQLKATIKGSSKKVTWKSSNKKVATVNSKGQVTAKKVGVSTITAKSNGISAKCVITVKRAKTNEVDQILDLYKTGKYSKAQKLANKLPKKDNTEYHSLLSYHEMVMAYWRISSERANKYKDVWETYMTDIDKNGIPEYIMQYGSCEADVQLAFYTFKGKKAVYCGNLPGAYSTFFAYPGKNGLLRRSARQGVEQLYKITLRTNKVYNEQIGKTRSVPITENYIELPYKIDSVLLQ